MQYRGLRGDHSEWEKLVKFLLGESKASRMNGDCRTPVASGESVCFPHQIQEQKA